MDEPDLRQYLAETLTRIYRRGLTTTSGGNVSVRTPEGDVLISPAREDKGCLTAGDMVRVATDGSVIGKHPPSSELPFHHAVYAARPDVQAIVHAHPPALVAFSISGGVPDVRLLPRTAATCGPVAWAAYACPGTAALGERIAASFDTGANCVLLENHGVVVAGETLQQAFQRFDLLEHLAAVLLRAHQLGDVVAPERNDLLTEGSTQARARVSPQTCQDEHRTLRDELCRFARRAHKRRLVPTGLGSFSARLEGTDFLITPEGADFGQLIADDIVKCPTAEPASEVANADWHRHYAVYARHPDVRSIVFAQPLSATAFGMTSVAFDSRTIPESYLLLRDAGKVDSLASASDAETLAGLLSANRPALILPHFGAVAMGTSVLAAFDRLEVLEATADALIAARSIGEVRAMSPSIIQELCTAFGIERDH